MVKDYEKCMDEWNNIFSKESTEVPKSKSTGNEAFDRGVKWVCEGTSRILDFGCGDGTLLFKCAMHGTKYNTGIDFAEKAIMNAKITAAKMDEGEYDFISGSLDKLEEISDSSFDAVVLSNVIDNLYPEDAEDLINEVHRILCSRGKLLVKVNPYVAHDQIVKEDIKVIDDDVLDDGLILLNKTTEEWASFFKRKFDVFEYKEIDYPEYKQINRMFCLIKK